MSQILFPDIGFKSINHYGEQLCGDHIETIETESGDHIIVLADGLGSGVKASILSTLTSKIISTMLASGLKLEDCVETVATTLPICSEREVAYSTFTIIRIIGGTDAEIIQFDNPLLILLRNGHNYNYPKKEVEISGKKILITNFRLHQGDTLIMMSDGCPFAGSTPELNYGWQRSDIITFMETLAPVGYNAKTLASELVDQCNFLYDGKPGDDTTACVIRMQKKTVTSIMFGPPKDRNDDETVVHEFFENEGNHIVCGGTTASVAGRVLGKDVRPLNDAPSPEIPPMSEIEGIDLVTEGIVTLKKVLFYLEDYVEKNEHHQEWNFGRDAASLITRTLLEDSTHVIFYAGGAINPAHQILGMQVSMDIKTNIVKDMEKALTKAGKKTKVVKC